MEPTNRRTRLLVLSKVAGLALLVAPVTASMAQMTSEEEQALNSLKQALMADATNLPAQSAPEIYEAQFALTIDQAIGGGTGAGAGGANFMRATVSNQHCLMALQAVAETLAAAPNENARKGLLNLRGNLLPCRGGTGAGETSAGLLFDLPQPQTGGGADYVN